MSNPEGIKYLQPIAIALSIAVITATGSMLYRHDNMIDSTVKDLYEHEMAGYEYHIALVDTQIRVMELREDTAGKLDTAEKNWVSYLKDLRSSIQADKLRATEDRK